MTTQAGVLYSVTSVGYFDAGNGGQYLGDAEFASNDSGASWTDGLSEPGLDSNTLDLMINGAFFDWGPFSPSTHTYTTTVTGTGSPLNLQINDPYPFNNTGGVCVSVTDAQAPVVSGVDVTPNGDRSGITITANADDTSSGGSVIQSAQYRLTSGSTTVTGSMNASDGSFNSPNENVTKTVDLPGAVGTYEACVRATDAAGNTSAWVCKSNAFEVNVVASGPIVKNGVYGDTGRPDVVVDGVAGLVGTTPVGMVHVNYKKGNCHFVPATGNTGPYDYYPQYDSFDLHAWTSPSCGDVSTIQFLNSGTPLYSMVHPRGAVYLDAADSALDITTIPAGGWGEPFDRGDVDIYQGSTV